MKFGSCSTQAVAALTIRAIFSTLFLAAGAGFAQMLLIIGVFWFF
jgi:hypothetical protein